MKLKEGMTFEVVEVIYSNFEGGQFNCFCNTIAFSDIEFLINNPDHNGYFEKDSGWRHTGEIHSKRTTQFVFAKCDSIKDHVTNEKLGKVFLVVSRYNVLHRGNETDENLFFNRESTPANYMEYWKKYDVAILKKQMKRKGITQNDIKNG